MRYLIFLTILVIFALPVFVSAQQDQKFQVPDTIDEAKQGVLDIGDKVVAAIPEVVAGIWENEVVPAWKAMWDWVKEEVWQKRVKPALEILLDKIKELLGREIEKRKPLIEQEFEQEKQELKEDIKTYGKSAGKGLWERFQALFSEE